MKLRVCVYLLLFLFSVQLSGQEMHVPNNPVYDTKPIHFGFSLGLNMMDFYVQPGVLRKNNNPDNDIKIAETVQLHPGLNVQIISNFRLNDDLDFRFMPGLVMGDRTLNIYTCEVSNSLLDTSYTSDNQSTYLDFPFLLKYSAERIRNYRPYVVGGMNVRYDLSTDCKDENDKDMYDGTQKFELQKTIPFWEAGVGIDLYPHADVKVGIELKYSRSIGNTLAMTDDNLYISHIEKLNSSVLLLSLHFE